MEHFLSDSVLREVAEGVEGAMARCLSVYGGLVWSIVRRLCRDSNEAEDVVQEVFVDLWKSARRFDEDKSSEKTFVAMVARRRAIDRVRAKMRRPDPESLPDSPPESPSDPRSVGDELEVQEEAKKARRLMSQLRDDERIVLELAIDGGLSQTEISQKTGMPLGTVKSHARRGMIRLRDLLAVGPAGGSTIQ